MFGSPINWNWLVKITYYISFYVTIHLIIGNIMTPPYTSCIAFGYLLAYTYPLTFRISFAADDAACMRWAQFFSRGFIWENVSGRCDWTRTVFQNSILQSVYSIFFFICLSSVQLFFNYFSSVCYFLTLWWRELDSTVNPKIIL